MKAIDRLEKLIDQRDLFQKEISDWTVGMQIEHALKAHIGILRSLNQSEPGKRKQSFNFKRLAIFAVKKLPRGRAKSPKAAEPTIDLGERQLRKLVDLARSQTALATRLDADAWFDHYIFGVMNKSTSIKFSKVHLNHHAQIAEEIVAAN